MTNMGVEMGKSKQVNFDERNVVAKSNQLIQGKLSIRSVHLNRILYSVISCINPNVPELVGADDKAVEDYYRYVEPDSCLFKIVMSDFIKYWKLHNNIYHEIGEICEQLTDAKLSVAYYDDEGGLTRRFINAVEFAEYTSEDGVYVRVTPSVMPYLVNLHHRMMGYTNTPMGYLVGMTSQISWKMLELLLQKADIGRLEIDVVTLRELFDCVDKYPKFYHFRVNVIDFAIKEIGKIEGEDADITYDLVKRGRSITGVVFNFKFPKYLEAKRRGKARAKSFSEQEAKGKGAVPVTYSSIPAGVSVSGSGPSKRALEMMAEVKALRSSETK